MQNNRILGMLIVIVLTTGLGGCARQLSSQVYSAGQLGEVIPTTKGVIVNTRQVRVDSADLLEENGLGLISGGVLGGLVGSTIGQGTGRVVAAGVGVLLGSVGGTFFEKKLKAQMASEYIIRLDSGQLATLVQAPHPVLAVGQRVLVMTAQKGRSRVVADTTIPSTLRS